MKLPECDTLRLEREGPVLHLTLDRPAARNAMSEHMVDELVEVFEALEADDNEAIRVVVMRGAEGNFCAGGDIKDMATLRQSPGSLDGSDDAATYIRRIGRFLELANSCRPALVAVLEGAVLGGGFGVACVSDVAIARADAKFGLPETGLGLVPAQISPFVVARIGLTQARRLGVCGVRFDGAEALRLGLIHFSEPDDAAVNNRLQETIKLIQRCAPDANAATKKIMLRAEAGEPLGSLLDHAAVVFSTALHSEEGREGNEAFIEKRRPHWAQ